MRSAVEPGQVDLAVGQFLIGLAQVLLGLELGHAGQQGVAFLGDVLGQIVVLGELVELAQAFAGLRG